MNFQQQPDLSVALDGELYEDVDSLLAQEPEFQTVCDESRDAWISAMEDANS